MNGLSRGYFWSILTMMGMPFLMIGGAAWFIWRSTRRQRASGKDRLDP